MLVIRWRAASWLQMQTNATNLPLCLSAFAIATLVSHFPADWIHSEPNLINPCDLILWSRRGREKGIEPRRRGGSLIIAPISTCAFDYVLMQKEGGNSGYWLIRLIAKMAKWWADIWQWVWLYFFQFVFNFSHSVFRARQSALRRHFGVLHARDLRRYVGPRPKVISLTCFIPSIRMIDPLSLSLSRSLSICCFRLYKHTHTHTHTQIYIYIYMNLYLHVPANSIIYIN